METSPKNAIVSLISEKMIASVIATDTTAAAKSNALTPASKRERREGRRTRLVRRPIAPSEAAAVWSATLSFLYEPLSAVASSSLAVPTCSSVSGTILAASAMADAFSTV